MASLPDIPGKGLVTGTGRHAGHAGKAAIGAGVAMIAVGGYVVKRLIGRGGEDGAEADAGAVAADPIAETPAAPPGAEANPDPTEWPEPSEVREDPRDPPDPDAMPFGEEPHPPTGAESTSEPHPDQDPEAGD